MFIDIGNNTLLDVSKVEVIVGDEQGGATIIRTSTNIYTTQLSLQALKDLIEFGTMKEKESDVNIKKEITEMNNVIKTLGTFSG